MIADVFERVWAHPALADVADRHRLGDKHLAANMASPSIVWVPIGDTFRRGAVRTPNVGSLPRALYTRTARVEIHLTSKCTRQPASDADELRASEELQQRFISALHSLAFGGFTLGGAAYPAQQGESIAQFGIKQVLSLSIEVPVVSVDDGLTTTIVLTEQIKMVEVPASDPLAPGTTDPTITQP